MASGCITSWQLDVETMETLRNFIFGGSNITADLDCSHEIKRCLLLGRKAMTKLDSILKSRDITLPTKVCLVKAMVFPVVRYACEIWTIKKDEWWKIDTFELWCWRSLLGVPWTARKSNQSILKEISPEYSLEELMLKVKLQHFGHLMQKTDSLKKTLILGRNESGRRGVNRGWDVWMASLTQWTWVWVGSGIWWWPGKPGVLQSMGSQRVGHDWLTELNWTEFLQCWGDICYTSMLIPHNYVLSISPIPVEPPSAPHSSLRVCHSFYFLIIWDFHRIIKSFAIFEYIFTPLMALLFASLSKATSHPSSFLLLPIANQSLSAIHSLPYTFIKSVLFCPIIIAFHVSIISSQPQSLCLLCYHRHGASSVFKPSGDFPLGSGWSP